MRLFKIKLPLLAAIVAMVFAVGTTAFTKISKPLATYTFAYQPTTYDQTQVQNVANWAIGSPNCNGLNKACEIEVDELYTHLEGSTRVLNNASFQDHVTIAAKQGQADPNDYVVDASNSIHLAGVSNKP